MKYYHERIETNSLIPARIYISRDSLENSNYPLHWHNSLEFDLVIEGIINAKVNGESKKISAGDFLFINSGDLHETDSDNKKITSVTVLLSYKLLKEYCPDADSCFFDFSGKNQAKEKIKQLLLACGEIYESKREYYELELSVILRQICLVLLKDCKKSRSIESYNKFERNNIRNVKKAISFMEQNYDTFFTLNDIAEEIGMAPTYFSRFFKKATGETFYTYLNQIRLYYAHIELMNSDSSITEIALNNGFANVKSFIEAFKRGFGTTPSKYKRNLKDKTGQSQ